MMELFGLKGLQPWIGSEDLKSTEYKNDAFHLCEILHFPECFHSLILYGCHNGSIK